MYYTSLLSNNEVSVCLPASKISTTSRVQPSFDRETPTIVNSFTGASPWKFVSTQDVTGCTGSASDYFHYRFTDFDHDLLNGQRLEVDVLIQGAPVLGTDYWSPTIFNLVLTYKTAPTTVKIRMFNELFESLPTNVNGGERRFIDFVHGKAIVPPDRMEDLLLMEFEWSSTGGVSTLAFEQRLVNEGTVPQIGIGIILKSVY